MAWTSEYMAQDTSSQELEHFGVKGMKWGIRKQLKSGNPVLAKRFVSPSEKSISRGRSAYDKGGRIVEHHPFKRQAQIELGTRTLALALSAMGQTKFVPTVNQVRRGATAVNVIAGVRRGIKNQDLRNYRDSLSTRKANKMNFNSSKKR